MLRIACKVASFIVGVVFVLVLHVLFAWDDWRVRRIRRKVAT